MRSAEGESRCLNQAHTLLPAQDRASSPCKAPRLASITPMANFGGWRGKDFPVDLTSVALPLGGGNPSMRFVDPERSFQRRFGHHRVE